VNSNVKKSESSFLFKGQKKEFLDWLESLRISKYWLDTMSHADSYALCNEIYQVLQNFKDLDLIEKEKIFSLLEINSCLQGVYEKLQISYLDSKLPLNKEQQESVKIVISTYMALANAYCEIIVASKNKKNRLSEQHLALNACKGFQALGIVFLASSQVYTTTPTGFWLLCYQLFSAAEELSLLDSKVKIDNAIYSAAILFKQLIIFNIIDKNQLPPKETEKVFQSLLRGINYVQSYILATIDATANPGAEIFGFSLTKDEPPTVQKNVALATAKLLRYVEKIEVIKIMQFLLREAKDKDLQIPHSPNPDTLTRILITLEYQKNKRQTRINKVYDCCAIIGLDNLVEFLLEKEGKKSTTTNKKTISKPDNDLDGLHLNFDWESEKELKEDNSIIENLQIIDSSMTGYGVSCSHNITSKLQIGEVIGIIPGFHLSTKKIEICLIRRIKVTDENIIFGVELIGLESTLIYIERSNSYAPAEWVPFLFGSHKYDVGILCHKEHNYQEGESIFVQLAEKKIPCQLGALLNSTPLLDHITLSY
jgi:hypothetical protein